MANEHAALSIAGGADRLDSKLCLLVQAVPARPLGSVQLQSCMAVRTWVSAMTSPPYPYAHRRIDRRRDKPLAVWEPGARGHARAIVDEY
jgi:hypothetical protein